MLIWFLLLLFLCAYYPPFFTAGVRQLAIYSAKRSGLLVEIAQVNGSLFEPVTFSSVTLSSESFAGSEIHLRIARAEAAFSLKNLIFHRGNGCLSKLEIDGMDGEIILSAESPGGNEAETGMPIPVRLLPASIKAKRVNLAVHEKNDLIFFQNIECSASDIKSGTISIEKIHVAEPWLSKTFYDVRGTMALQNSRISVASVVLEKGMQIENASANLPELMNRKLKMDFQLLAFGGDIRGEIRGFTRENQHLNFEATGSFSKIAIPELAVFLNSSETTGGTIQDGKFAFYGSLRDLKKARFSTRLVARDFQWGRRQWNSLVLGAIMVDRHLQIPNLELRQAHNSLTLSGEIAIPDTSSNWLQTDFNFNLDAKIDNVTELSLLFGPDFANTAGMAAINGSIRGQAMSFTGDLTVSGSNLSYQTVPIDTLHASVNLNGNELQITSFELVHQTDFLRGKGGANLFREKKYWGEVNASIADLALYSAILQPAIVGQFYGGGLALEWSGDGTAKTHSGAFHAQLKNVHPLETTDPKSVPLNADLEGTYSPENIFFKKFTVSNATSSISAIVAANQESISVDSLQLKHDNEVRLEGAALLPFSVWRAWRHLDASCWNPSGECKIDLTAKKLDLHEALMLTGREFPLKGEFQGKLTTSGTLSDLSATGQVHYSKGEILLASGLSLFEMGATVNGKIVTLEKSLCRINATDFTAGGEIDFKDFHNPALTLSVNAKAVPLELSGHLKAKADLNLNVNGPFDSANLSGSAIIQGGGFSMDVDLFSLIPPGKSRDFEFNPELTITQSPFDHWQIDLICTSNAPLENNWKRSGASWPGGTVWPNLRIRGSGSHFITTGSLYFQNIGFKTHPPGIFIPVGLPFINEATLFLQPDQPAAPLVSGKFSAKTANREISGYLFGAFDAPRVLLVSNPPLPEPLILQLIHHGFAAKSTELNLPSISDNLPLELQSPYLDESKKSGRLIPVQPDEMSDFALHGPSDEPVSQETTPPEPAP